MGAALELSVVIPAFNEQERLPGTLASVKRYLECRRLRAELILVDDGSQDQTPRLMEEAAAEQPYVKVVRLETNRGKGRAIAAGVEVSRGRLVLVSDADLSTPIEELDHLKVALEEGAGVAIASRALRLSRIEVHQPVHRVLMGKCFNLVAQALFLPGLWDTQCGFKLFPGDAARLIFSQLEIDGFAYDVEALWRARKLGLSIREVPVTWRHSAPTRVSAIRHSAQMLADLIRLRLRG